MYEYMRTEPRNSMKNKKKYLADDVLNLYTYCNAVSINVIVKYLKREKQDDEKIQLKLTYLC